MEKFIKALGLRGSREAIRQWYHRFSKLMEYILKSSQELYVDETKIKRRRGFYYLWLAIDSKGKPCFAYLSRRRDVWTFGRRNPVERAFFPIKHGLRGFYKRFPWNAKYGIISSFFRAFIFLYYTLESLS